MSSTTGEVISRHIGEMDLIAPRNSFSNPTAMHYDFVVAGLKAVGGIKSKQKQPSTADVALATKHTIKLGHAGIASSLLDAAKVSFF